jgi:hypothetical protein
MTKLLALAGIAIIALASTSPAQAAIETYDISWTGTSNYSMTGVFSFDSSAGAQVRDYEVTSLSIDVLHNGVSIGTWTLPTNQSLSFNFNFDALTGTFDTGGNATGNNGQLWNYGDNISSGFVGFGSGENAQAVSNAGGTINLGLQFLPSTLTATLVTSAVPEPASWAMLVSGFGILGATIRRRRPACAAVRMSAV